MILRYNQEKQQRSNASAYVKACKSSVQGSGGSGVFYGVAVELLNNYPPDVAWDAPMEYNDTKCQPKWTGKELEHKWQDARKAATGYTAPTPTPVSPTASITIEKPETKLVITTNVMPTPMANATITHLETCFKPDEIVNIALTDKDKKPIGSGAFKTRAEWVSLLLIKTIYEIFNDKEGNGCYICVNPLIEGKDRKKEDIASYRHLLVEFDEGSLQEQWTLSSLQPSLLGSPHIREPLHPRLGQD